MGPEAENGILTQVMGPHQFHSAEASTPVISPLPRSPAGTARMTQPPSELTLAHVHSSLPALAITDIDVNASSTFATTSSSLITISANC